MTKDFSAEEMLANVVSPTAVSRDEVRQWVSTTRSRIARRKTFGAILGFLIATTAIWFSLVHQAKQIRQMVVIQPSRSMVQLEEITQELCRAQPAEYFVRQLVRNRNQQLQSSAINPR